MPRFFKCKLLNGDIVWAHSISDTEPIAHSQGREFKIKEVDNKPCERGWYNFVEIR